MASPFPRWAIGFVHLLLGVGTLRAQCPDGTPPPCPGDRPATPPTIALAVLYFDNASRDSADDFLAQGISEEIINRLSGVPRLNVRSRYAVLRWRGRPPEDLAAAARRLQVQYLVTGAFRRSGTRIRVNAELVRAGNDVQVWSDAFEQDAGAALDVVPGIAGDVATAILGRLQPPERRSLATPPTRNYRAWEHFIRGNLLVAPRRHADFERGIREYEQALALDPTFAAALARNALALALSTEWTTAPPDSGAARLRRAAALAERALRLNVRSSDAWLVRGYVGWLLGPRRVRAAREALERAIALDSSNSEAWHQLGSVLSRSGADSLGERAFQRALELEPARVVTWYEYARLERARRRLPHARSLFDSAVTAGAPWQVAAQRAQLMVLLGDTAGARAAIRELSGADSTRRWGASRLVEVHLRASQGDTARARALLEEWWLPAIRRGRRDVSGCGLATVALIAVGERALALRNLEAEPSGPLRAFELRHPACDPLRTEPGFQRLLAEPP